MSDTKRMSGRTAGTIFLVVGIVLFVVLESIAVVLTVRALERSDWPRADGTVVEVSSYVDRDTSRRNGRRRTTETTMYRPVVEFSVNGQQYRFTSKVSTSDPWTVGDTVEVVYNPDNPNDAAITGASGWVPWLLGGLGLVFGLVFGGVGWLIRTGRMGSRSARGTAVTSGRSSGGVTYKDFSAPAQPYTPDPPDNRNGPQDPR